MLFAVQEGTHLVQVDAQVLAVGADPLARLAPGANRRRIAGGHTARQTVAQNTPTGVW